MTEFGAAFIEEHGLNLKIGQAPVDLVYDKITQKKFPVLAKSVKFIDFEELLGFFVDNLYVYEISDGVQELAHFEAVCKELNMERTEQPKQTQPFWRVRFFAYENDVPVVFHNNLISATLNNEEWKKFEESWEESEPVENKLPIKELDG